MALHLKAIRCRGIWCHHVDLRWSMSSWFIFRGLVCNELTLDMWGPSYLGLTRSISWLMMPWHLTSPGHQQHWYWLYRICTSLSYLRKDLKYLCHINMEEWHKMEIYVYIFSENLALKGLISDVSPCLPQSRSSLSIRSNVNCSPGDIYNLCPVWLYDCGCWEQYHSITSQLHRSKALL